MTMTGTCRVRGHARLAALVAPAVVALAALAGCGARSALEEPLFDAGAAAVPDAAAPRVCEIVECTVGHACCLGGCDGPAVPRISDCCPCVAGEVSSTDCGSPSCAQ